MSRQRKALAATLSPTSRERPSSSKYGTPKAFYAWLNRLFSFTVDVAAEPANAKHKRFWSEDEDGLAQLWDHERFFCNPPYGRGIGRWFEKGRDACVHGDALGAYLVPARVGSKWWKEAVLQRPPEARAIVGTLRFARFVERSGVWFYRF